MWVPNTDVILTKSLLVIVVELAGMRKEELELTAEEGRIRIQGRRGHPRLAESADSGTHLVKEINFGSFETMIETPHDFDPTLAKATYQIGFLLIEVPKRVQVGRF